MMCDTVRDALGSYNLCEETNEGARVPTHCLYPSFEVVHVYVARFGDGYKIHDSAGAYRAAWAHGRDIQIISRFLSKEAARYHLAVKDHSFVAEVPGLEWLHSGILAVSNASAAAANRAVAHFVVAAEENLIGRIYESISTEFNSKFVLKEFSIRGKSGKEYRFDIAVRRRRGELVLINAVFPHPTSISSKYVSFADAANDVTAKFAVHDKPLEAEDISLMQQVAEIVPFRSVAPGVRRALAHG